MYTQHILITSIARQTEEKVACEVGRGSQAHGALQLPEMGRAFPHKRRQKER